MVLKSTRVRVRVCAGAYAGSGWGFEFAKSVYLFARLEARRRACRSAAISNLGASQKRDSNVLSGFF